MGHECPFCLQRFTASSSLEQHLLTHTEHGPYSCVLCSKDFQQPELLSNHLETHADLDLSSVAEEEKVDIFPAQPQPVEDASHYHELLETDDGLFADAQNTAGHEDWSSSDGWCHSGDRPAGGDKGDGDTPDSCASLSRGLGRHGVGARGRPHQCVMCAKGFSSPYKLRRHQLTHTGERPFQCSLCHKAFRQLPHLKLHTQAHGRAKPGNCTASLAEIPQGLGHSEPQGPGHSQQALLSDTHPTQLYSMTATSSSTDTGMPNFAKYPCFTEADTSSSDTWGRDYISSRSTLENPDDMNQASGQYSQTALRLVKVSCNGAHRCASDQISAHNLSESRNKQTDVENVPHLRKPYQGPDDRALLCRDKDNESQTSTSCISKSPKTANFRDVERNKMSGQKYPHECQTCLKRFSVPSKLHRHMLSHSGQRPFPCHFCSKSFRQLCHLKFHLRSKVCLKPADCSGQPKRIAERNFSNRFPVGGKETFAPMSNRNAHTCANGGTGQIRSGFDTGVAGQPADRGVTENVSRCNKPYKLHHAENHTRDGSLPFGQMPETSHPDPIRTNTCRIVHECPVCLKCFSCPSKLKRHCLIHTGQRPFPCSLCRRAFRQLTHLKVHYKVHERSNCRPPSVMSTISRTSTPRPKAFVCNLCGWSFRHQTHLAVHLQRHKASLGTLPITFQAKNPESRNPVTTEWRSSDQRFVSNQGAHSNSLAAESDSRKIQRNSTINAAFVKNRYGCSVCGKAFDSPSKLYRHSQNHSEPNTFSCLSCSKDFTQKIDLTAHRCSGRIKTSSVKQSETSQVASNLALCSESQPDMDCYVTKVTSGSLGNTIPIQTSLNSGRTDSKTSVDCGKGKRNVPYTAKAPSIIAKGKVKSTNRKGHQCNICQRVFSVPSKLSRHLLIHMGIKPFACTVCGKTFRQSIHLQTHLKTHGKSKEVSGDETRQHGSVPSNCHFKVSTNPLPKDTIATTRRTTQRRDFQNHCLKQGSPAANVTRTEHLSPSKPKQNSVKNSYASECKERARGLWQQRAGPQADCLLTAEEIKGGPLGLLTVQEINNIAEKVNGDADTFSEDQIFIDPPLDDRAPHQKASLCGSDRESAKFESKQQMGSKRVNCCSICLKKFESPSKLARHFLIHMGIKPFSCQVCSKTFRQLCHLQSHLKVHKRQAPKPTDISKNVRSRLAGGVCESLVANSGGRDLSDNAGSKSQGIPLSSGDHMGGDGCDHYLSESPPCELGQSEKRNLDCAFFNICEGREKSATLTASPKQPFSAIEPVLPQHISMYMTAPCADRTSHPLLNEDSPESSSCPAYSAVDPTRSSGLAEEQEVGKLQAQEGKEVGKFQAQEGKEVGKFQAQEGKEVGKLRAQEGHYITEMGGMSGDDATLFLEALAVPSSDFLPKEEVLEVQFEIEGVDKRLTSSPNDLLVCPDCSRGFATHHKFCNHGCVRAQTGIREKAKGTGGGYQCAICYKSFQVPSKLKRHYLVHTGQRPFPCPHCAKTFTQATHLKTHLNTHR